MHYDFFKKKIINGCTYLWKNTLARDGTLLNRVVSSKFLNNPLASVVY